MSPNLWNGFSGALMGMFSIVLLIPWFLFTGRSKRNLRPISIGLGLAYFYLSVLIPLHPDSMFMVGQPGEITLKAALCAGALLLTTNKGNAAQSEEEKTDVA